MIAEGSISTCAIAAAVLSAAAVMLLLLLGYCIGSCGRLRLRRVLMLVRMLLCGVMMPVRLVVGALLLVGEEVLHGGYRRR